MKTIKVTYKDSGVIEIAYDGDFDEKALDKFEAKLNMFIAKNRGIAGADGITVNHEHPPLFKDEVGNEFMLSN